MSAVAPLQDRRRSARRFRLPALAAFVAVLVVAMSGGAPVSAHTDFASSQPAQGDVVSEPVTLVTIVFTGEGTPVGDEFIARDAAGNLQRPVAVSTVDNKIFSIRFEPPLAGGEIGIRWNVQAADAHPIEGAFSFTVTAPAPTTAAATTLPATTLPATTVPTAAPAATAVATTVVAAPADATPSAPLAEAAPTDEVTDPAAAEAAGATAGSLEDFLAVDNSRPGETLATTGRVIGFLGVALGLGVLCFAATVLRGSRVEVGSTLLAVRALGIVVAVGAVVEYVGTTRTLGESLGSAWSTTPGIATTMRIVGGLVLAVGVAATVRPVARSLSAAVIDAPDGAVRSKRAGAVRWVPDVRSSPALLGALLMIVSFWFDGHTVSKGVRPLHALVNSVHVAAGAVWVGGVVAMAVIVAIRHRADRPTRAAELVVRFSTIATVALGAVVVAGAIMAVLVLDSFGELTGTEWGQILLLKTSAVALAMVGGAYNHFRLLPALEADPESPELQARLRSTVTAEAIMLAFVVVVTAWLVVAAS